MSSLASFALDFVLVLVLMALTDNLLLSVVVARICSATLNFTVNRRLVFDPAGRSPLPSAISRYVALAAGILIANYGILFVLHASMAVALPIAKLATEAFLFAASFLVQKHFVFVWPGKGRGRSEPRPGLTGRRLDVVHAARRARRAAAAEPGAWEFVREQVLVPLVRQVDVLDHLRGGVGLGRRITEVRVRDLDQCLGALPEVLAEQVDYPVLRHDVVHVGATGHDPGARLERGHDAGHLSPLGGRGHGDDRLAAFRSRGPSDEVDLPAEPGVDVGPDGVGANLAGQVDLDRGVDGHEVVVLADHEGVVDVLDGVGLDEWIVVEKLVELLGAERAS